MSKCPYETEYWDPKYEEDIAYTCLHPPMKTPDEDGENRCIFHSKREDKDTENFYKEFKKLYESGDHNFTGFIFPEDFDFRRLKKETGSLKFVDAGFSEALFLCDVNLSVTEFLGEGDTNFKGAKFTGKGGTNFSWAKFSSEGGTDFSGAQFSGEGRTKFYMARFSGEGGTNFSWAQLSDEDGTDFGGAKFFGEGETNFSSAKFSGKGGTDFSLAQFSGEGGTDFSGAKFSGEGGTDFRGAQFSGKGGTNFSWAQFSSEGETDFRGAQFSGKDGTDFSWAQFSGEDGNNFTHANFSGIGEVAFYNAQFANGTTRFSKVLFGNIEGANFNDVIFYCPVSFDRSKFKKRVSFINSVFHDTVEFIGSNKTDMSEENHIFSHSFDFEVDLRNMTFSTPDRIIFNMVNLSCARLLNTDFSGVRLGQVNWGERDPEEKRLIIYDEKKADAEGSHREVSYIYKQLRVIYEKTGRYFNAGDFFFGEMEMRRRQADEGSIIKALLYLYRLISGYGERPIKAFCCFLGTPVLFTLFYFFSGLKNSPRMDKNYINYDVSWSLPFFDLVFWKDLLNTLFFSIHNAVLGRTFTTLMPEGIVSTVLCIFENIIGVIFLSLFILAMNRKFRRTKD